MSDMQFEFIVVVWNIFFVLSCCDRLLRYADSPYRGRKILYGLGLLLGCAALYLNLPGFWERLG